jgi:hypothetical protein
MALAQWCAPCLRQHAGSRLRSPAAEASGASISNSERVSSSSAQSLCTSPVCHKTGVIARFHLRMRRSLMAPAWECEFFLPAAQAELRIYLIDLS